MVSTSSTSVRRILVANRGEIARRVFRTCRDLGIETVAVHSDADAALPFVGEADAAVRLPGNTPAETYLRGDLIIDAARRAGADAVHPGYGFLSESAEFARAVLAAGLTWVGPTPESMELMATKIEAKKLMAAAGVPVLGELSPETITEDDLPVLVKASSGGGGRGMRVVRSLAEVSATVEQASSEAASAFGDPTVFVEPYVEKGRHVEVQIWGDHHGTNLSVLGARDCSLQRRHQKVVEEAPPYNLPEEALEAMYAAARAAGAAIGYVGVGTVEFLYDPTTERFWFLEMNTRLQVEHPVTELVTGLDLVELQLRAAEDPTALAVTVTGERGHAVEVRLYAEDPHNGWQPQSGRLTRLEVPGVVAEFANPGSYGLRLDSGFEAGNEVGTHYDAMIAKVIAWGPDRESAFRRLAGALGRARIHGLRTNRDLLVGLLRDPAVLAGDVSTDLLDNADLTVSAVEPSPVAVSAFAAAVVLAEQARLARPVQQRIPAGWRNVVSQPELSRFLHGEDDVDVRWYGGREGFRPADLAVSVMSVADRRVVLEQEGVSTAFDVFIDGDRVDVESSRGHVALTRKPRFVDPADQVAAGSLLAPMPGAVIAVHAGVGATVSHGQPVLVMEAMKMQHTIAAPYDGVVAEVAVNLGDQVAAGAVLAVVQPLEETGESA